MTEIIYLDIDGTLRDEQTGVPDSAVQAIRECRKRGIRIVICTGRNPGSIQDDVKALETDGIISGGGCYIHYRGESIKKQYFSPALLETFLEAARRERLSLSLESEQNLYMDREAAAFYREDFEHKLSREAAENTGCDSTGCDSARCDSARCDCARCDSARCDSARCDSARCDCARCDSARCDSARCDCADHGCVREQNKIRYEDNLDAFRLESQGIHKICLFGDRASIGRAGLLAAKKAEIIQLREWNGRWYLEVLPKKCGKGAAVELLNRRLRIPKCHSMSFGDGENDIAMLQATGVSIAVGGGDDADKLKPFADSMCEPPAGDGICKELLRRNIIDAIDLASGSTKRRTADE